MAMKQFYLAILCFCASDVFANDLVVTKKMCEQLVIDHTPDADVAYKPDQDLDMGPPADIGGTRQIKLPEEIRVPINVDLQKYMGSVGNPPLAGLDYGELGSVVVHSDGRMYYNGQPLFDEDAYAIKEACRKLKEQ